MQSCKRNAPGAVQGPAPSVSCLSYVQQGPEAGSRWYPRVTPQANGCSLPPRLDAQHSAVERERAVLAAERAALREEHARVQQQQQDLASRLEAAASSSAEGEEQVAVRARAVAQREEALERRARELEGQQAALAEQRSGLAQQEAELQRQHAAVRELVGEKQRELEAAARHGEELARQQAGMQVRTLCGRCYAAVRHLPFSVRAAPVWLDCLTFHLCRDAPCLSQAVRDDVAARLDRGRAELTSQRDALEEARRALRGQEQALANRWGWYGLG